MAIIKLLDLLHESWDPLDKSSNNILYKKEDLSDESTISQFIIYFNLPKNIIDIWKYAHREFNKFPTKITNKGMEYSGPGSTKIELEFTKDNKIRIYKFQLGISDKGLNNSLLRSDTFSFKVFREMMTNE